MSISQVFHMKDIRENIFNKKCDIIERIKGIRMEIEDRHRVYDLSFMNNDPTLFERIHHEISLTLADDWRQSAIILGLHFYINFLQN